jgi:hypothetical protein
MQIPEIIQAAVGAFHNEWRHPRLPSPKLSELYSLFPEETRATPTNLRWPPIIVRVRPEALEGPGLGGAQ